MRGSQATSWMIAHWLSSAIALRPAGFACRRLRWRTSMATVNEIRSGARSGGVEEAFGGELLAHPLGGLGTQRGLLGLLAFELSTDQLDLPALAVEEGKLWGRGGRRAWR